MFHKYAAACIFQSIIAFLQSVIASGPCLISQKGDGCKENVRCKETGVGTARQRHEDPRTPEDCRDEDPRF